MATVAENIACWSNWDDNGDKWSVRWGGPQSEWWRTIAPRVHTFLPTATVVEIGCGHGRWSQFLQHYCFKFVGFDITQACVAACEKRFRGLDLTFRLNDGRHLEGVMDEGADFIFSFDSLVHADAPEMRGYLAEFAVKLAANGAAFIHHSNMAEYPNRPFIGWRSYSVSGSLMQQWCEEVGLCCVVSERVSWDSGDMLSDCFSLIVRKGSVWDNGRRVVITTSDLPREMDHAALLANAYDWERKV